MPNKRSNRARTIASEFAFISDKRLREDISDALFFAAYLLEAADKTKAKRYKEEFYRATVLYVASAIEALCLFLINLKQISREKTEYRHTREITIPGVSVASGDIVIGIREKKLLELREIPFVEANRALVSEAIISKKLGSKIDQIRIARNTQHLYGRARSRMSRKEISTAFEALSPLLETIRKTVSSK